jgi:hypothetical protein
MRFSTDMGSPFARLRFYIGPTAYTTRSGAPSLVVGLRPGDHNWLCVRERRLTSGCWGRAEQRRVALLSPSPRAPELRHVGRRN